MKFDDLTKDIRKLKRDLTGETCPVVKVQSFFFFFTVVIKVYSLVVDLSVNVYVTVLHQSSLNRNVLSHVLLLTCAERFVGVFMTLARLRRLFSVSRHCFPCHRDTTTSPI